MKDLFVRRVYTSYGINIVVELDFVKKTVTLAEKDGDPKNWIFADHTLDYLNGWRAILKSMEYAVEQAQNEMLTLEKQDQEDFARMYIALDKALKKGQGNPDEL